MADNKEKQSRNDTSKNFDSLPQGSEFLTYKGKPLVRCKDCLYYGSMLDDYVVKITVESKKVQNGLEIADKLLVQLMSTKQTTDIKKLVVSYAYKENLYMAMDLADAWLSRALGKTGKDKEDTP